MSDETRLELVLAAVRWANNMLTDVLSRYARDVGPNGADKLRGAVSLLADADRDFRKDYARKHPG